MTAKPPPDRPIDSYKFVMILGKKSLLVKINVRPLMPMQSVCAKRTHSFNYICASLAIIIPGNNAIPKPVPE